MTPARHLFAYPVHQLRKFSLFPDGEDLHIGTQADLEFQDLNIVQKCFKVLSLASCLVRPINASYKNDGISFHVLYLYSRGNPCVSSTILRINRYTSLKTFKSQ